jgi:hypothetical protein
MLRRVMSASSFVQHGRPEAAVEGPTRGLGLKGVTAMALGLLRNEEAARHFS